jgi:hypothetical protein
LQIRLLSDPVTDRKRGPNGPFGIILVRHRRTEDGHHRVPDELLDRAATPLEFCTKAGVIRRKHSTHVLRIELLRMRGEADEIDEHDRHDLPFLRRARRWRRGQRRGTKRAERKLARQILATRRTARHQPSLSRPRAQQQSADAPLLRGHSGTLAQPSVYARGL